MRKYDYFWLTERDWWHWDEATGERMMMPRKKQKKAMHIILNNVNRLQVRFDLEIALHNKPIDE